MQDWIPTIMSMLGQPDLVESLKVGASIGERDYRVHLDGVDQSELITGAGPSKRKEFYYFTETVLHGLRYGDWKVLFKTQDRWFNGIQPSAEWGDQGNPYSAPAGILANNVLLLVAMLAVMLGTLPLMIGAMRTLRRPVGVQIQRFLSTFADYPPRQRSFDLPIDELMNQLNPARTR